jgi:hypothetical protein
MVGGAGLEVGITRNLSARAEYLSSTSPTNYVFSNMNAGIESSTCAWPITGSDVHSPAEHLKFIA